MTREPTEKEYTHAEETGWRADRRQKRGEAGQLRLTAHLWANPNRTLCGKRIALATSAEANEYDEPCRECRDVADPAAAAALMPDEVPFRGFHG